MVLQGVRVVVTLILLLPQLSYLVVYLGASYHALSNVDVILNFNFDLVIHKIVCHLNSSIELSFRSGMHVLNVVLKIFVDVRSLVSAV